MFTRPDVAAQVDAIMSASRARFGHGRFTMLATLDRLEEERDEQIRFMEQILSEVDNGNRDMSESEKANMKRSKDRIKELDDQIEPLKEFEALRSAHRASAPAGRPASRGGDQGGSAALGAQTQARGHEYRTAGEMLADAWRAKNEQDSDAAARLESIGRGIDSGKLTVLDRAKARDIDAAQVAAMTGEQRASAPNVTTVEIPGVLPVTIQGALVNDIDVNRPFLNSIGVKDMSGIKGKTFTRPVVTEHVQMGTQSAEKTAVQAGQFKIDDVDFTKSTEGGYVDVSRQSIDWSSPAMWDALMTDFLGIYARHTENKAADAFLTSVQLGTAVDTVAATGVIPTLNEFIDSLYAGAAQLYANTGRMPDRLWVSFDRWALVASAQDKLRAGSLGDGGGTNSIRDFQVGTMLDLPRTVVPSFATGTVILGLTNRVEAYEERLGFLSAVEPKLLGIELAYGGYFASGVLDVDAFVELTYS